MNEKQRLLRELAVARDRSKARFENPAYHKGMMSVMGKGVILTKENPDLPAHIQNDPLQQAITACLDAGISQEDITAVLMAEKPHLVQ